MAVLPHFEKDVTDGNAECDERLLSSQLSVGALLNRYEYVFLGLAGIALFLGIWVAVSLSELIPEYLISAPQLVGASLYGLFASGAIVPHLWVSLQEFFVGYILAAVFGIATGILMGWFKRINYLLDMLVSALYSTPRIAFVPLFLVFFGVIGIWKTAATVFIMAFFPILINTMAGVRLCEQSYVRVGRALGATDYQLVRDVVIPGSLPSIIAGLRLATSLGLTALVVGDLFGAQAGLGYLLSLYGNAFRTSEMIAVILVFSIAGMFVNIVLKRVENMFSAWRLGIAE